MNDHRCWYLENPTSRDIGTLQSLDLTNPFATPEYALARRMLGARVVLFAQGEGSDLESGALGFLGGSILNRWLEITSAPALIGQGRFWEEVKAYCKKQHVTRLDLESFGSRRLSLPTHWKEPSVVRDRIEWLIELTKRPGSALSANHRRSIAKAVRAGVSVTMTTDVRAAQGHARLMAASMQRRAGRGESVSLVPSYEVRAATAYLSTGAGRVYQAWHEGEILSSLLVLVAPQGAYYQSAGTTAKGMELGVSAFLVSDIIRRLAEEGVSMFNLGGAGEESPGLLRFKSSFGATPITLRAGSYDLSSPWQRKMRTALRLLRRPSEVRRAIVQIDTFVVFAASSAETVRSVPIASELVRLDDDALAEVLRVEPEYEEHRARVLSQGFNAAYALREDGAARHIAWLIEYERDVHLSVRHVRLRPGEAEITHCYTPKKYRGTGVYTRAIGALASVAFEQDVKRVFMITSVTNIASRKGIVRAGFRQVGFVWHVRLRGVFAISVRGHRWPRLNTILAKLCRLEEKAIENVMSSERHLADE
jgi:RimJ/RimL family protein N-acetyltransferase